MTKIKSYNEDNFREIEQYKGISVIRFSAAWCPPCKSSEAAFEAFAGQLDAEIMSGRVNVDQAPVLNGKYEIWGLSSVLIFSRGQLVSRIPGVKSSTFYAAIVDDIKKGQ